MTVPVDEHTVLALCGADDVDAALLQSFTGQLALVLERRRLRVDAAAAQGLAEANELRTALLAAVSHDLRTPLSAIKAAASTLLQGDIELAPTSAPSCSRASTKSPIASTRSSATCST